MGGFRRVWRDDDGAAAIEFAIIGPVFLLLVAAIIEAGFIYTGRIALDAGAREAARYGMTGAQIPSETRTETIRRLITEHVCPKAVDTSTGGLCYWAEEGPLAEDEAGQSSPLHLALDVFADPRNVGVHEPFSDVAPPNGRYDAGEDYVDVNGNGTWEADTGRAGPGGPGDVVVYRAAIHQAVHTPLVRLAIGDELIRHEARVVVRNEPY